MRLVRPWWSVACLVMVLGCGSDNPEANPTAHSIEIRPGGPLTMRQGDTSGFNVIVRDRTGAVIGHGPLSCSTSARNVATSVANTLYDSCQLAAVGAGTAIIQAEVEGVVGQMTVKVLTWPRGEVSGGAHGVAVRGSVALVTTLDNHVDRIDPASGAVQAQYDFTSPYVALSADASHAFFGNVVFDLASGTQTGVLVNDISSCGEIGAAVERPQGSANYVGCSVGVVIASSSTADILATLPTSAVSSFALDPTGDHLYATSFSAGRVYEISTATNTLARELPILGGPQASVAPGDNELYEAMESQRRRHEAADQRRTVRSRGGSSGLHGEPDLLGRGQLAADRGFRRNGAGGERGRLGGRAAVLIVRLPYSSPALTPSSSRCSSRSAGSW